MENETQIIELKNASGATVRLTNVGAGIMSVFVADRNGKFDDVCLGYANPTDYLSDGHCFGRIPGRYANRIAKGRFSLDGKEYTLEINNGPNALHGGSAGFHFKIWNVDERGDNFVTMSYRSPDGDGGFPGSLLVKATYRWTDSCELQLTLSAVSDAPTVINLTNHAYWNLAGHNSGSVLNHELHLPASAYLPTDSTLIPTGRRDSVEGTPMDFRTPKTLGRDIGADFPALRYGKGYDNCWIPDGGNDGALRTVAELTDRSSGRRMTVISDQPGVQVYTGNWLSDSLANKSGSVYIDHAGVAIECQAFPDAPNHPDFPSAVLRPGDEYKRTIIFRFTVI